ncbi:hypothetical protein [Streptomyces sp. UG1]|uniref:hypothetical protein n=1 Tax=Streptomyces sp. UG1 TaxID=3417652 RepID=UPI003CE6AA51
MRTHPLGTVTAFSPALAALYGTIAGRGRIEPVEPTLTITPPPASALLRDLGQIVVDRGHARVVDQRVEPAEPLVDRVALTAAQASYVLLATTTSAPQRAAANAMARPSPGCRR